MAQPIPIRTTTTVLWIVDENGDGRGDRVLPAESTAGLTVVGSTVLVADESSVPPFQRRTSRLIFRPPSSSSVDPPFATSELPDVVTSWVGVRQVSESISEVPVETVTEVATGRSE
ncbi:hypothetical protein HK104_004688, partial [Borealophlyctis nickersoniae]